jgi:hypothetical protein
MQNTIEEQTAEIRKLREDLTQVETAAKMAIDLARQRGRQRDEETQRKAIYYAMLFDQGLTDDQIEQTFAEKEAIWNG